MEYTITSGAWTFVGDTGVEVLFTGDGTATVTIDEQGAVVLPAYDPVVEADRSVWSMRPGTVPVTRAGDLFDLEDPERWPAPFVLVDGHWQLPAEG